MPHIQVVLEPHSAFYRSRPVAGVRQRFDDPDQMLPVNARRPVG